MFSSSLDICVPQALLSCLTPGAASATLGQETRALLLHGINYKDLLHKHGRGRSHPSSFRIPLEEGFPHGPLRHVIPCFLSNGCEFGWKEKLQVLSIQRHQGKPATVCKTEVSKGLQQSLLPCLALLAPGYPKSWPRNTDPAFTPHSGVVIYSLPKLLLLQEELHISK